MAVGADGHGAVLVMVMVVGLATVTVGRCE